ncbi:MAG: hypothetical protein ACE5EH_06015 [Gammaproteobacteria bacterium]
MSDDNLFDDDFDEDFEEEFDSGIKVHRFRKGERRKSSGRREMLRWETGKKTDRRRKKERRKDYGSVWDDEYSK